MSKHDTREDALCVRLSFPKLSALNLHRLSLRQHAMLPVYLHRYWCFCLIYLAFPNYAFNGGITCAAAGDVACILAS